MRQEQQEEQAPFSLSRSTGAPDGPQVQQDAQETERLPEIAPLRGRRRRRLRRALQGRDPSLPLTFEQVMAVLEVETHKRHRRRIWTTVGVLSYVGLMLLMVLTSWILHHKFDPQYFSFMGSMGGVIGGTMAFSRTHRAAARRAAELRDVRAVGHLATALEMHDKETRLAAIEALIALLPELRASDAGLLNAEQRESLYKGLRSKNSQLVIAILKSLEQIGDSRAIPYVEKLQKTLQEKRTAAEGRGRSQEVAEIDGRLQAAQECLQFLQDHVQQEQAKQTLLRASDAAHVAPDSLLRPAAGTSEPDAGSLLRASKMEEEGRTDLDRTRI